MTKVFGRFVVLCSLLVVGGTSLYGQAKAGAFTGFWVMDTQKTSRSKDFPERLKDYRLLVSEDQDRLMVKAQVVGPVEVRAGGGQSAQNAIVTNSAGRTSASLPTGVTATSSTSAPLSNSAVNYGGTMALYFTAGETTFDLTGKEITIEPMAGDRVNGTTRMKAKPGKDGRSIEFTIIRKMRGPRGEVEITTHETWKTAEDGLSLKFHRSVESPTFRDEITMVLAKQVN